MGGGGGGIGGLLGGGGGGGAGGGALGGGLGGAPGGAPGGSPGGMPGQQKPQEEDSFDPSSLMGGGGGGGDMVAQLMSYAYGPQYGAAYGGGGGGAGRLLQSYMDSKDKKKEEANEPDNGDQLPLLNTGGAGAPGMQGKAKGGRVSGRGALKKAPPGHAPSDKIPAVLTKNEHVMDADTASYYGHDAMDMIRARKIPRESLRQLLGLESAVEPGMQGYAYGGPVYQQQFHGQPTARDKQQNRMKLQGMMQGSGGGGGGEQQGGGKKSGGLLGMMQGGAVGLGTRNSGGQSTSQQANQIFQQNNRNDTWYGAPLSNSGPGSLASVAAGSRGQGGPLGTIAQTYDVWEPWKNQPGSLEIMAPAIAASLAGTQEYANAQNYNQFINPQQAYGQGAGQIAQQGQQALVQGQNQLASMGLANSAAQAGLANQVATQTGGQQADLMTNLYQDAQQQRYAGALNNYNMLQDIVSMALGNNAVSERMLQRSNLGKQKGPSRSDQMFTALLGTTANALSL